MFSVGGSPGQVSIDGTAGTALSIAWSADSPDAFDEWSVAATAVLAEGTTTIELPERNAGFWLMWFTDLPPQDGGEFFYTTISEVRFAS